MENTRQQYLKIERIINNLIEISKIQNNFKKKTVDKFPELLAIYESPSEFYNDYEIIEDFLLNNNKNKELMKLLVDTTRFINGMFKMKKEAHIGKNRYYRKYFEENPMKAIKIVAGFIEAADDIDKVPSYLYSSELFPEEFDMALDFVKKNDKFIYDKYEEKLKYLEDTKYERNIKKLEEIALGIKTGYLSDGTKFDQLQFLKLAPFKYSKGIKTDFDKFREINPNVGYIGTDNFYRRIESFGKAVIPNDIEIILEYMEKNHLCAYTYLGFEEYKKLHRGYSINLRGRWTKTVSGEDAFADVYGKDDMRKFYDQYYVTPEMQRKILQEVIDNNFPHLMEVYAILEEKYVADAIAKETEKQLVK